MNPKLIFGLFVVVALAQISTPIGQIIKHEDILRNGKAYKLRTRPVDPYDPFRGRYVALSYADTEAPLRQGDQLEYRQLAYVSLKTGTNGFAEFVELSATPPAQGDYLRVEYSGQAYTNKEHRFFLPFDKFFMEESVAPRAERAYWETNRRGNTNDPTYVVVRVKGGRGVIENLFIKDQPVREYLQRSPATR